MGKIGHSKWPKRAADFQVNTEQMSRGGLRGVRSGSSMIRMNKYVNTAANISKRISRAQLPRVQFETAPFLPNTAMVAVATAGYVPFVLNLHASLQRIGLGNQLLVYTPDGSVRRELSAMGVRSLRFGHQRLQRWSDHRAPGFAEIVAYKYAGASELLNAGSNVLFVDSDIVFLRNPAKHLRELIESSTAHLTMQFEAEKNVYNTGFWFARPEPLIVELFKDIQDCLTKSKKYSCDQECFNELICQRNKISIHALDVELFACGNQFLGDLIGPIYRVDRSSRPFPKDFRVFVAFQLFGRKGTEGGGDGKAQRHFLSGLADHA